METRNDPEQLPMRTLDLREEGEQAALPLATTSSQAMAKATPQEARVVEVTQALEPAYQRASTLELTDDEIAALMENFPDEYVEIRPHDGLIYIPHIHISNRLNKVLKPGKWSLIQRRNWFDADAQTMYGEYVLVIRGCYVGESVGGHPYISKNAKTNYSDALESTAAEALRRIAGKRLSCGSQVWDPEYAREWVRKYAFQQNGKWHRRFAKPETEAPKAAPKPASNLPSKATEATRAWMVKQFEPLAQDALAYAIDKGIIMPNETLMNWPLEKVPLTKAGMIELIKTVEKWAAGASAPSLPPDPKEPEEPWRRFPVPFGSDMGTALEDLPKPKLFGWWANFKVEPDYNGRPKKADKLAMEEKFRAMLDEAGKHYNFRADDSVQQPQDGRPHVPEDDDVPF